ncbi:MAG: hypothetical protein ACNA7Y_03540 [Gammaproteobacteria bacterium]
MKNRKSTAPIPIPKKSFIPSETPSTFFKFFQKKQESVSTASLDSIKKKEIEDATDKNRPPKKNSITSPLSPSKEELRIYSPDRKKALEIEVNVQDFLNIDNDLTVLIEPKPYKLK